MNGKRRERFQGNWRLSVQGKRDKHFPTHLCTLGGPLTSKPLVWKRLAWPGPLQLTIACHSRCLEKLGSVFGRKDFFTDFLFLGRRIFARIFSPDFFSSFLWEKVLRKILQENHPLQNPPNFIQKSPTHFCRGVGPREVPKQHHCGL